VVIQRQARLARLKESVVSTEGLAPATCLTPAPCMASSELSESWVGGRRRKITGGVTREGPRARAPRGLPLSRKFRWGARKDLLGQQELSRRLLEIAAGCVEKGLTALLMAPLGFWASRPIPLKGLDASSASPLKIGRSPQNAAGVCLEIDELAW
jgi:hypothetical protein